MRFQGDFEAPSQEPDQALQQGHFQGFDAEGFHQQPLRLLVAALQLRRARSVADGVPPDLERQFAQTRAPDRELSSEAHPPVSRRVNRGAVHQRDDVA